MGIGEHPTILWAMDEDGKVLGHFPPFHCVDSCLFKFLSKVLKLLIVIKFSPATQNRTNDTTELRLAFLSI